MAKNSIRDFSATAGSNTDIQSVNIDENCPASGINNAIRELMVDLKNVSTGAVALESPAVDQLNFADNAKAIFGAGAGDLEIFHDGSNSNVIDTGTGGLQLRGSTFVALQGTNGENGVLVTENGSAQLRFNNSPKLESTATGCDITGVLTADGVTVTGTNADLVLGTTGSNVTFNRNGDNYISASGGASSNIILDPQNRLAINTGGSERMRILSDGRVTIGHSAAINISILGISNRNATSDRMFAIHNASGTSGYFNQIAFRNNADSANIGEIVRVNDASVSYNTTSDYRLKTAITYDWDATTRLKQLKPARFAWIADPDRTVDGFLAHEVQSVIPEAITGTKDEVEVWKDGDELPDGVSVGDNKLDENGDTIPVMQGIDQSKIVPLLVKTIQELEARIAALEA